MAAGLQLTQLGGIAEQQITQTDTRGIKLKRRLDLAGSVKRAMPQLIKAIERELNRAK